MKAIICTKWGPPDVLQLREVEKPVPKDNEVLIRIYATTVFAGDSELRRLKFPILLRLVIQIGLGLRGPRKKILGQELAGEIESVGENVKQFKEGDQVFGTTGFGFGTYAEYKCLPEKGMIAIKPINMTHEEAATVPLKGLEALYYLGKANIQKGQRVLINGAGGSIGTIATQFAKHFGAEVTCVDSTGKLDMLQSIGADHVIDYTQEDFTKNGQTYDVIFDVVGRSSFSHSNNSLEQNGYYLSANPGLLQMFRRPRTSNRGGKNVIAGNADHMPKDLVFLKELIESGKIKPVIDKTFPLEQIAEAHSYVDTGHKIGNVVITVEGGH